MSILFILHNEEMILKIMEVLKPSQWGILSRNVLKDNLLHHFIKERYVQGINRLLSLPEVGVTELCFQLNIAGNYPIMVTLSQNMEDTAFVEIHD